MVGVLFMNSAIENMAINYFRGLDKTQRKLLLKRIFDSLSSAEKLEVAKLLIKNK